MILDEIYDAILIFRRKPTRVGYGEACPFPIPYKITYKGGNCDWCKMLFPEICHHSFNCPCIRLGNNHVESEMRRLFP